MESLVRWPEHLPDEPGILEGFSGLAAQAEDPAVPVEALTDDDALERHPLFGEGVGGNELRARVQGRALVEGDEGGGWAHSL